ncbi:MAG TPA: DUF1501 domain-containing protein [Verrucomicrobiae bacterium]|nr:DUF1501 domain-containing protein [Verrucomicrobiae bacterium]
MSDTLTLKTRRDFLRTTALGSAFTWTVPTFLAHTFAQLQADAADKGMRAATGKDSSILVILQMAGGNDGLNTIVPYANDHYQSARPRLGLRAKQLLKINDDLAFNANLAGLKALYDEGQLSIVQGVGYPNPNRSHFRSTEIWQTASDSQRFERYGWLGRYFDNACKGADPTVGVCVGRQMPQAFAAKKPMGVSLEDPQSYKFMTSDRPDADEKAMMEDTFREMNSGGSIGSIAGAAMHEGSTLDYVERTALDAQISSEEIRVASNKVQNKADYPQGRLGGSLKLVARLIGGGLPTRIFYVSQGGYDTHSNQINTQERLLKELGDSVRAFMDDIKAQGNLERVTLMTFSEFGRRVAENASGGTDHGAASVMFVAGNKINAGLLGKYPSLAPGDLFNGDPKFTTDFRSVYAGVLEQWLKTSSTPVLGRKFEPIPLVKA